MFQDSKIGVNKVLSYNRYRLFLIIEQSFDISLRNVCDMINLPVGGRAIGFKLCQ